MSRGILRVFCVILGIVVVLAIVFAGVYGSRLRTLATVEKLSSYSDYNLYRMDVKYDYDLDSVIAYGIKDDQSMMDAILKEALPFLPVHINVPSFACSAFTLRSEDGKVYMGRNYDFKNDTSSMLVYCTPKNGYKSVAFAALDNINADAPETSLKQKIATLIAPFVCLDGMNEKGVSIAVLTLDSKPTHQETGKPTIATSLAIRMVLDRAATTEEAVELLQSYDMYAPFGRDYHFYITDASGDGRVIEYDCDSEKRELVATPVDVVTNFFTMHADRVQPNQKNGIYGHGKERYEKMLAVFDAQKGNYNEETAWTALKSAAQEPNPEDVTSNTQWSIVYNNTDLTAKVVLRRHWDDVFAYNLHDNAIHKL